MMLPRRRRRLLTGALAAATAASLSNSCCSHASSAVDPVILDLREASRSTPQSDNNGQAPDISVDMAIRVLNSAKGCGDKGGKSRGRAAHRFLTALASSDAFRRSFRRRPVLIRSDDVAETSGGSNANGDDGVGCGSGGNGSWASGLFTLEDLLSGIDGTVIPGQRTGDSIRDGSKADRWEKNGPISGAASGHYDDSPMQIMTRADVTAALRGGTIFFNHAMLGFPTLAAVSTLMTESFGT